MKLKLAEQGIIKWFPAFLLFLCKLPRKKTTSKYKSKAITESIVASESIVIFRRYKN